MGRTIRDKPVQRGSRSDSNRELTSNPFQSALKDFKVPGPECLHCSKELDTREGRSLPNPRGSRNSLRHGYMHATCELEVAKKFSTIEYRKTGDRYLQYVTVNEGLLVPVFTDTELLAMIKTGETS